MSSSNRNHSHNRRRSRYHLVDPLASNLNAGSGESSGESSSLASRPTSQADANPRASRLVPPLALPSSAAEPVRRDVRRDEVPPLSTTQAQALRNPKLEALKAIESSDFSQRLLRGIIQDIESGIRPEQRRAITADVIVEDVIVEDVIVEDVIVADAIVADAIVADAIVADAIVADAIVADAIIEEVTTVEGAIAPVLEGRPEAAERPEAGNRAGGQAGDLPSSERQTSDFLAEIDFADEEDFSDLFDELEGQEARAAFDIFDELDAIGFVNLQRSAPLGPSQPARPKTATESRKSSVSKKSQAIDNRIFEEAESLENIEAQTAFDALDAIAQQPSFRRAQASISRDALAPASLLDDAEAIEAFDALSDLAAQQTSTQQTSTLPVSLEPAIAANEAPALAAPVVSLDPVIAEGPSPQAKTTPPILREASLPEPAAPASPPISTAASPASVLPKPSAVENSPAEFAPISTVPVPFSAPFPGAFSGPVAAPTSPSVAPTPASVAPRFMAPVSGVPVSGVPGSGASGSGVSGSGVSGSGVSGATRVELNLLRGTQTFAGRLTAQDPTQAESRTYRFSLSQPSDFNLVLEGLSANAEVSLLDGQGNLLKSAHRSGNLTELLGSMLNAGDYQIQISARESTDYRLVLSTTPDQSGTANNLEVSAATYLGGSEDDTASAVEFSPQRELVVAGNFGTAAAVGVAAERSLLNAGLNSAGQIVRMSASGQEVLSITHLGDVLNDMDVNRANGSIVAGGDFGIAVLNAAADQVLWSQDLGAQVERVAIANNGTVVTLHNKTVTVWSPNGEQLAQTQLTRSYVEDIAIDPDTGAIYVAGYDNKYNNVDGNPVQVAFLTGYDGNLNTKWSSWGYDADTLTDGNNDMADTRGYRVTVGRDGNLYFLGEVAGGNSVFRWNGKDRSTETLVKFDAYNDPYNSKSPHQTYYARINPENGEVLKGQLALARLSNGLSNAVRVYEGSITADEAGNVYIGGRAFSGIDGRDRQTINGEAVGDYTQSDPFALVVSSDFQSRKNWTTFVKDGAQGSINGFAVGEGRAAVVGTIDQGSVITSSALNPLAFNPHDSDKSDVYLATWATDTLFEADQSILAFGGEMGGFGAGDPSELGEANRLQFSAASLGGDLRPGTVSDRAFVLGSRPSGKRSTFLYDNGVLSFDADGSGAQAPFELLTLTGNPGLKAEQIAIVV